MAAGAGGQLENVSNLAVDLNNRWLSRAKKSIDLHGGATGLKNKSTIFQIAFNFAP